MQGNSGHYAIDHQYDNAFDVANNPLMMDFTLEDPFYSSFYNPTPGMWSETRDENQELLSCDNNQEKIIITEKGKQKMLSREAISKCFYMPINQAAKELNIGVTLLKIRCRDLGIRRGGRKWYGTKWKDVIDSLEEEKKRMEEIPDMELEEKTKKLRQSCFKANHKKRKLMGMANCGLLLIPSCDSGPIWTIIIFAIGYGHREEDDEDEVIKSLLADRFNSMSPTLHD
ncbi:protein RKD3-like [Lycium ferocissimum]|uniref:protein RKD3-like n=1 Tax=Lycium ferocissimum TaxID=112874 RepID=UPI002815D8A7|nr:protein RKD3-like [Lycium ferocissimum]